MILNQDNSLLLTIDVQEKLLNAVFNRTILEKKAKILSEGAEVLNLPIIVTEQYPKGLGKTVIGLKDSAKVFEKTDFNALCNLELFDYLRTQNKKQIIVFGIETHICVYQTVEALLNNEFEVIVVSDACGSRAEEEHLSALSVMNNIGASIKTTEMVLFELLKGSSHPNFKQIQSLIK